MSEKDTNCGNSNSGDNTPNNENNNARADQNIIIVGDWFVDEHWVTGVHRSSSASRPGEGHHRVVQGLDSVIEAFCGAGRTASLLYQADENRAVAIYGIGIWHKDDKDALKGMFKCQNLTGQNHHRLSRRTPQVPPSNVYLYNLAEILVDEHNKLFPAGTSRIIRTYHLGSDRRIQYNRVDWELEGGYSEKHSPMTRKLKRDDIYEFLKKISCSHIEKEINYCDEEMLPNSKDVNAIVLKDLLRGVVTRPLVEWFAEKYPDVPWFVSTKAWKPDWLDVLKDVNLRILLIPQAAAKEAIKSNELGCWITPAGYPEKTALTIIGDLEKTILSTSPNPQWATYRPRIIVLPDGFKVLAYDPRCGSAEDNNSEAETVERKTGEVAGCGKTEPEAAEEIPESVRDIAVHNLASIKPFDVDMGMASVFLPVVVTLLNKKPAEALGDLIEKALRHTYKWVCYEGERVTDPENWDGMQKEFMAEPTPDWPSLIIKELSLKQETDAWDQALNNIGVVKKIGVDDKKRWEFQLWRSMVEIDGYACCVNEERAKINQLIRGIKEARSSSGWRYHVCCMLLASPGSGKTFFARQLAETLDFRFLPFNITQMVSRSDILDCFDTIVTTQAQTPQRPLMVFVDEINARLEGDFVYNAFLTPVEEGVYMRRGRVFRIAPCLWIFSGTEDPVNPDDPNRDRSLKGSDFKSRLTLGVISTEEKPRNSSIYRTQNVYRAVAIIRSEFPDVRYVSKRVLKFFMCMMGNISVRKMKNTIKSFVNVQYGKLLTINIPEEVVSRLVEENLFDEEYYRRNTKEGPSVVIVSPETRDEKFGGSGRL